MVMATHITKASDLLEQLIEIKNNDPAFDQRRIKIQYDNIPNAQWDLQSIELDNSKNNCITLKIGD